MKPSARETDPERISAVASREDLTRAQAAKILGFPSAHALSVELSKHRDLYHVAPRTGGKLESRLRVLRRHGLAYVVTRVADGGTQVMLRGPVLALLGARPGDRIRVREDGGRVVLERERVA